MEINSFQIGKSTRGTQMAQKYMNIPVKPEVYLQVKLVAEANDRGLGDQVAHWVGRELPECEHDKQAVQIEYFPSEDVLLGTPHPTRTAWFCPTCRRVYARLAVILDEEDAAKMLKVVKG